MSTSIKLEQWVGMRPLRALFSEAQSNEVKPRVYIAKLYETLGIVLESLWSHQLKYEISDIGTLLLSDEGRLYTYLLEQKSHGFFDGSESLTLAKQFLCSSDADTYPGHAVICLFIIARAHSNTEIRLASDLCEAIAHCLKEIEVFHNQSSLDENFHNEVLLDLFKRWKQAFPYSE